jgi:hypothetical protein
LTCDLFIRSYWKDLGWLRYCLESIAANCNGFRDVIVVAPQSSRERMQRADLWRGARFLWGRDYADDYLGQQATKLLADLHTDADLICHVDSDCVFNVRTTPEDLMREGQPCIVRRSIEVLGGRSPWRAPTEKFLGWPVTHDYMHHPPFLYPRWLYANVRAHATVIHGVDIETYLAAQPRRGFSEFNVLGALAWALHRDEFVWIDADASPPAPRCRWYWSWGGLDAAIRREIERILPPPGTDAAP